MLLVCVLESGKKTVELITLARPLMYPSKITVAALRGLRSCSLALALARSLAPSSLQFLFSRFHLHDASLPKYGLL